MNPQVRTRYGSTKTLAGWRLVHNFLPHGRGHGVGGFRYWVTRERKTRIEKRCHCGWLDGRKHYGTLEVMNQKGKVQS